MLAAVIIPILFVVPSVVLPAHATGALYVSPANLTVQPVGTMLTYQVKVAGMDSFNGWDVTVETNSSVLDPVSIDATVNLFEANFSSPVIEVIKCVDGVGTGCNFGDVLGDAHSSAVTSGAYATGNGLLFTITYRVVNPGYSFLTIPPGKGLIYSTANTNVIHTSSDGVYGTPPANLPVADFTFSPATGIVGGRVTFNASSSSDPAARITDYVWKIFTFGLGAGVAINNKTSQPLFIHLFSNTEVHQPNVTFSVSLVVNDDKGLSSRPKIQLINVLEQAIHKLVVLKMRASPQDDILPGTPINIIVAVLNKGTFAETGFNLTVYLNGRVYKNFPSAALIVQQQVVSRSFVLPTTGLQPDSYDLVASVSNDTSGNGYLTVRIISRYQGSLIPFTMPQFAGVIIAVIAALGVVRLVVGRSRLKRRLRAQELS